MINELIKLSNHLDNTGYDKEANYLDAVIRVAHEEEGAQDDADQPEEKKQSKWHRMKMTRVVEEMDKNDFNSLSFEIDNFSIRITKNQDEDCD